MLDQNIKTQLKAYLERLESPIELVAALDESDKAEKINPFFSNSFLTMQEGAFH